MEPYKYIDIHVHANPVGNEGLSLEKLDAWMTDNNVERSIVLPLERTMPKSPGEEVALLENYKAYAGRIDRYCFFTPQEVSGVGEAVERLQVEKTSGALGFGEHYGRGLAFNDPLNMVIYEACAEVGLPALFHMDGNNNIDEPGLPLLKKTLKTFPACTFIAHAPGWWGQIDNGSCHRLLQEYPNLYGDLSAGSGARAIGRNRDQGREFVIQNAKQLLFGTDIGEWSLGKEPPVQFSLFNELDLSDDVKESIFRGNAEHLFEFN